MSTYLAFDYGLTRIGVASGQTITKTSSPLTALKANNGTPNWEDIGRLIAQWQPDALVVGLPINMDGTDNPITIRARKFAKRLHGRFHLTAHLVDERLSTQQARELTGRRGTGVERDGALDTAAACVILDQFLQSLD